MGYLLVPMFSESFNIQNQLKEDTETAILIITSKQIRLKYQILYGERVQCSRMHFGDKTKNMKVVITFKDWTMVTSGEKGYYRDKAQGGLLGS